MNNEMHEMKTDGVGKFVKEYNPKYPVLEIIIGDLEYGMPIGIFSQKKAVKKFGNYKILSIMDFNDTKSTSLILEGKEKKS